MMLECVCVYTVSYISAKYLNEDKFANNLTISKKLQRNIKYKIQDISEKF